MESYNTFNRFGESAIHTIRVTFQCNNFFGHVSYEIGGNCFGYSLFDTPLDHLDDFIENDCKLQYDADYDFFYIELTNKDGDTLEGGECSEKEIENMIVCMEIVKFEDEE